MRYLLFPFIALVMGVGFLKPTVGQHVFFSFPDGAPEFRGKASSSSHSPESQGNSIDFAIGLLFDDVVRRELEIVDSQLEELNRIHLSANDRVRELLEKRSHGKNFMEAMRIGQEIRAEINAELVDEMLAALLPHQQDMLQELEGWILSSSEGFVAALERLEDQALIDIDRATREAVGELQANEERQLLETCAQKYRMLLEKTGKRFPEFDDFLDDLTRRPPWLDLDVLLVDAAVIDELGPELVADDLARLCLADREGYYRSNGTLWFMPWGEKNRTSLVALRHMVGSRTEDFEQFLGERVFAELLELTQATRRKHAEISDACELSIQNGVDPVEAQRTRRAAQDELDRDAFAQVESEILLPHELNAFIRTMQQRQIASFGILGTLLMAESGGKPITKQRHEALRAFLTRETNLLRDEVRGAFHASVRRQIEALPADINSEVRQYFRYPPEYLLPSFSRIQLRYGQ